MVRRIHVEDAATCTVVVHLNKKCDLHIRTTARHALDVLNGLTVFAAKDSSVFDANGSKLALKELKRLSQDDAKS